MIAVIYLTIFFSLFIIGTLYVIINREKYEAEVGFYLFLIIYFTSEIIYFFLFNISTENYFTEEISIVLWSLSIFSRIFSIGLWTFSTILELHKNSKVKLLPIIFFIFIDGIIFSLLLFPNSFLVIKETFNYNYVFLNFPLFISILIFNGFTLLFLIISQIKGYNNFKDKKLSQYYSIFIFLLILSIIFYSLYISTQDFIIKNLHLITYIINSLFALFAIIRKPDFFLVFTNKIYDFIIFHKSGILLYSYNFQTDEEVDEMFLKGSILIGISHILTNFSNVENQLGLIKMSEKGVVFNFDNELGYALLLIVKHKNSILEKKVNFFMKKFSEVYKDKILSLNGLMDVSIFKNTGKLIKEIFRQYIVNK